MGFVLLVCEQPRWEVILAACAPVLAQQWHRSVGPSKRRVFAPASGLSLFPSTCVFFPFLPSFSPFRASCIAVSPGDHCLLLATSDAYQSNVASIKINSSSWSQGRAKLFFFFCLCTQSISLAACLNGGKATVTCSPWGFEFVPYKIPAMKTKFSTNPHWPTSSCCCLRLCLESHRSGGCSRGCLVWNSSWTSSPGLFPL